MNKQPYFERPTDQEFLRYCELRISGVRAQASQGVIYQHHADSELRRLEAAQADIASRINQGA